MKRKLIKVLSIIAITACMLSGCGEKEDKNVSGKGSDAKIESQVETGESENEVKESEPNTKSSEESKPVETATPKEEKSDEESKEVVVENEKIPTIEELFAVNSETDSTGKMSLDMLMKISGEYEEDGATVNMDMNIGADFKILYDKDTTYMDGAVKFDMMGMDFSQPMQMYNQKFDDYSLTYTYEPTEEIWIVTEGEVEDAGTTTNLTDPADLEDLFDLTLDAESSNDYYIVTGVIDYNKFVEKYEDSMSSLTDLGVEEMDNIVLDFVYKFNKSNMKLAAIDFSIDTELINEYLKEISEDGEKVSLDEFKFSVKNYESDNKNATVEIPEDVLNSAKTYEELLGEIVIEIEE